MWEAHQVPFELGYYGEFWDRTKPGLMIPIPPSYDVFVMACRYSVRTSGDQFAVVHGNRWDTCENLLMVAARVQSIIDSYQAR